MFYFREKQHKGVRETHYTFTGRPASSVLCGPGAADSAFPVQQGRSVVLGFTICGRNPEVPPTTSSHEPPLLHQVFKEVFLSPARLFSHLVVDSEPSAPGASNSSHPPCPFTLVSEAGGLELERALLRYWSEGTGQDKVTDNWD